MARPQASRSHGPPAYRAPDIEPHHLARHDTLSLQLRVADLTEVTSGIVVENQNA